MDSHFRAFIQKDEELPKVEEFYIRSGISISEIKMVKNNNIRALLTAEDDYIAKFLGDSESPAHTDWKERTEDFKTKYQNAVSTLRYVRSSLREITRILDVPSPGVDPNFLKEIFHIPKERGGKLGTEEDQAEVPRNTTKTWRFLSSPTAGGFHISLAKKILLNHSHHSSKSHTIQKQEIPSVGMIRGISISIAQDKGMERFHHK